MRIILKLTSIFLSLALLGQTVPVFAAEPLTMPAPLPVAQAQPQTENPNYHIYPGDTINITVFPAKEFSKEVTVQPDGTIEMMMIGSLKTGGLTAAQLTDLLTDKLARFVSKPQVTVNINKFAGHIVSVAGEVSFGGAYEYRDGMRLLDLIFKAGGPKDNAQLSSIKIFRRSDDGQLTRLVVDLTKCIDGGDMAANVEIMPQDTVYVPMKPFSKTARWISDNFLPWISLFTFGVTLVLLDRR